MLLPVQSAGRQGMQQLLLIVAIHVQSSSTCKHRTRMLVQQPCLPHHILDCFTADCSDAGPLGKGIWQLEQLSPVLLIRW